MTHAFMRTGTLSYYKFMHAQVGEKSARAHPAPAPARAVRGVVPAVIAQVCEWVSE